MMIYAAADLHGRWDRLDLVRAKIAAHRPDILVLAGDLGARQRPDVLPALVNDVSIPILAVGGNSDGRDFGRIATSPAGFKWLHLTRETMDGVDFVGVSGTLPLPFYSRLGFQEAGLVAAVSSLLQEGDVLVVHPPPYGTLDQVFGRWHAGSRGVARLIDQCAPGLVLCGHIHEQAGTAVHGRTVVVNCAMGRGGQGALIRYDGRSTPICRMLRA